MATPEEAYNRYLIKVEKNGTNDNTSTERGRFLELYNESQIKFTELHLKNRGIDDVRYIQHLLILDKEISNSSKTFDHFNFLLPKNYLDLADVRAKASKEKCKAILELYELKTENQNNTLQDEDNKPSFKWRESFYTANSNTISVYTDNEFDVESILLSYYRYPKKIALIDPNDPESKFVDTEIEWDDKSLDRIISMCAGEFDINENNPRFQAQFLRTQK